MKKREVLFILPLIFMFYNNWKLLNKEIERRADMEELSDKHLTLMLLLNQWLIVRQRGILIADYFYKNNIKSIGIYGMSYIGERLYDELMESNIEVKYIADKNNSKEYKGIKARDLTEQLPKVDAVIVTPVFYYDEIKKNLGDKVEGKILSLQDILYEL